MGTAAAFDLAVGSAHEVFLVMRPAAMPYLMEFGPAIGGEQHSRQNRHLAHWGYPAPAIPNALDVFEGLLVVSGFMSTFADLPVLRIILQLLPLFLGFTVGLEVYGVAYILLFYQHM